MKNETRKFDVNLDSGTVTLHACKLVNGWVVYKAVSIHNGVEVTDKLEGICGYLCTSPDTESGMSMTIGEDLDTITAHSLTRGYSTLHISQPESISQYVGEVIEAVMHGIINSNPNLISQIKNNEISEDEFSTKLYELYISKVARTNNGRAALKEAILVAKQSQQ